MLQSQLVSKNLVYVHQKLAGAAFAKKMLSKIQVDVEEEFKNINQLHNEMKIWNTNYNNLEHCGLNGKTPNEFLANY